MTFIILFIAAVTIPWIVYAWWRATVYPTKGHPHAGWAAERMRTNAFGWMVTGVVVSILFSFFASIAVGSNGTEHVREEYELKALGQKTDTSGWFFVFVGGYSSDDKFSFIRATGNGGYRIDQIGVRVPEIFESETPLYVVDQQWGFNPWLIPWSANGDTTFELHVPADSISDDISVKP